MVLRSWPYVMGQKSLCCLYSLQVIAPKYDILEGNKSLEARNSPESTKASKRTKLTLVNTSEFDVPKGNDDGARVSEDRFSRLCDDLVEIRSNIAEMQSNIAMDVGRIRFDIKKSLEVINCNSSLGIDKNGPTSVASVLEFECGSPEPKKCTFPSNKMSENKVGMLESDCPEQMKPPSHSYETPEANVLVLDLNCPSSP
ncbi:hypothetical protein V6N13_124868 [Hibiscus sabdariffa]